MKLKTTLAAAVIGGITSGIAAASNYTQYFDALYDETTGWGALEVIAETYEAILGGAVFWLLIVTMPFLCMWIKQKSTAIAAVVAFVTGGVLITAIPNPSFDMPIKMLLAIGASGLLWHFFIRRD